jgi:hypothetical protein
MTNKYDSSKGAAYDIHLLNANCASMLKDSLARHE